MRTYHVRVEPQLGIDTDKYAHALVAAMNLEHPGLAAHVSESHGSGPAIIVLVLDDNTDPKTITDEAFEEVQVAKQEPNAGTELRAEGSDAGSGDGVDGKQATSKRRTQ